MSAEETGSNASFADIQRKMNLLMEEKDVIDQRQHQGYGDAERYLRIGDEIDFLEEEMSRLNQNASHGQG